MGGRSIAVAAAVAALFAGGMVGHALAQAPGRLHRQRSATDPADTAGPLDISSVAVAQDGDTLAFAVRTRGRFAPTALGAGAGRSLCFVLDDSRSLCLDPDERVTAAGAPVAAAVSRTSMRELRVRVQASAVGLPPGAAVTVVARTTWVDRARCRPSAARPQPCIDVAPDAGALSLRLVPVRPARCGPVAGGLLLDAPAAGRVVALTFDDGPARSTPAVLSVLERERVPATFFVLGSNVAGHAALLRRMLADGDAIGDHSWDHADLAAAGPHAESELTRTNAAIERAAGYRPCLFRAPFGATSPALVAEAGALGMLTVGWDVDPRDWSLPGPNAILHRIIASTRPGAIVLMHDGGGPREQTVAALPRVIAQLRRTGYRFVTVPQLALSGPATAARVTDSALAPGPS
jgi:peptidoglycan/xylan/chitin deacetylase (PgdA/CDA1 family)